MLTNEVSVLEIETIELITGLFGVHDIFIYNECGAFGVVCHALSYLPVGQSRSELQSNRSGPLEVKWTYLTGPNLPKSSKSSSGVTL